MTKDKASFNMMLLVEERDALKEEARRMGITMTQILRMWIRDALMTSKTTTSKQQ